MRKKNSVRNSMILLIITVFIGILANGSFASVTKKELKERCEQNITQKLGSKANVMHSDIKALCATIDLIPQDNIDDELASWIISSYWRRVTGLGVGVMDIDSIKYRLESTTKSFKRICPLISHTGAYYKKEGDHLISVSRVFRTEIFGIVKKRLESAKIIKLDVSAASPITNVVRRVADSFAISVNNSGDDKNWEKDYSNMIESQIINLTLVEAIYGFQIESVYHDVFMYQWDLFALVPRLSKASQENSGISLHKYSDVKNQINDFLNKVLFVSGGVTYLDWGNLSSLLDNYDSRMWRDNYQLHIEKKDRKVIYVISVVPNMTDLLQKNMVDLFHLYYWKGNVDSKELLQDSIAIVNANP